MDKVKLTQAQAGALESINRRFQLRHGGIGVLLESHIKHKWEGDNWKYMNELSVDDVVRALYIGYEVKPEFKVGDWVRVSWSNTYPGIYKVTKTGVRSVAGNENGIEIDWANNSRPSLDIVGYATPEEIAKEKERRWWKSHNRDVWEIREDDTLEYLGDLYIVDSFDSERVGLKSGIERKTNYAEPFHFVKKHFRIVCFAEDRKDIKQ